MFDKYILMRDSGIKASNGRDLKVQIVLYFTGKGTDKSNTYSL